MRRDSFKTVRFGNQSSRTSSKASSPKTVLQNTPPSNPYRDIQQSFPNQSFFFSHDSVILWILVFSVYHLLAQAYLIFGEKILSWPSLTIVTSTCCICDQCFSLLYKESSDCIPTRRYSWKETILKSKMTILCNFIICVTAVSPYFVHKKVNPLKWLISVVFFNLMVLIRQFDRSTVLEVCSSKTSSKHHQFQVNDSDKSIETIIFTHVLSSFWQSMKLCIQACVLPSIGLFFDARWLLYNHIDLFVNALFFLVLVFPLMILYDFERNQLSWLLRIKCWKSKQLSKSPNLAITGMMNLLVKAMEFEFSHVSIFQGKHSILSLSIIMVLGFWVVTEIIWGMFSSRRRLNRVFIVGAVVHLSVLSLFVYLRNKTPQYIRKSGADRSTLQTQSFHPPPTHQHPIIPEFDKNLKNIVGQIYTSEQIQERYEDYVKRINELYNSPNVQFMIWRERQQEEQENRQKISLALPSGMKETESNK
mmetsp:Transcript_8946/g.9703  ORF Transcript_8946/g.9703 Transcript_8946/m.9703 type:complete len:476 (-) Transcript_8946:5-1432(-)